MPTRVADVFFGRVPAIHLLLLWACLASGSAEAQVASVHSQAELTAPIAIVDWTQLFGQIQGLDLILSPVQAVSSGDIAVELSVPPPAVGAPAYFRLRRQSQDLGDGISPIGGNFLPGDILLGSLADNLVGGPMTLVFDVPVFGFGAQIGPFDWSLAPPEQQPVACPGSTGCFSAVIEVFDDADNSLGSFAFDNLLSNTLADGSAPFIGVRSEAASIKRAVIRMSEPQSPFQIARLVMTSVPEPGALLLLTISVLAVLGPRPRRLGSACCTATIALAFGGSAQALVASVQSAQALGATQSLEWTQLYAQSLGFGLLLSPITAVSSAGTGVIATVPPPVAGATPFFRVRQQNFDIGGNFAPGEVLLGSLADNFIGGPMSFVFDVPVFGLGTQIGPFDWSLAPPEVQPVPCPASPGCFSATIEVFDGGGASLGVFVFDNLLSNTLADDSAPFIGVRSDIANIKRVVIGVGNGDPAFQISQLALIPSDPGPGQGTIAVAPASLTQAVVEGQFAAPQTFAVDNAGTGSLVYSLSENLSWLSLSPSGCLFPNACLTPPGPDVITASYDAALLPAGRYSGTISVSSVGATNSVVDLPVQLDVVGLPVVSLVPNPTDIDAGGSSTLSWSSSDADSCAAVGGWTASTGISGSQLVSPSITTTYTISCTGLAGTTQASAQVTVAPPPALVNDACLEATAVESDPFAESLDTSLASQSPDDPVPGCGLGPDGATVWYAYTPPASGEALVSTETSDYDTVVSVWPAAEGCGALETPVACNDDGTIGAQSRLLFHVDAGITYLVQVGDRNSGPGGQLEVLFIPEPDRGLLATAALVALALSHRVRRRARRE